MAATARTSMTSAGSLKGTVRFGGTHTRPQPGWNLLPAVLTCLAASVHIAAAAGQVDSPCPPGTSTHQLVYVETDTSARDMTYPDAKRMCAALGGELATLDSAVANDLAVSEK